MRADAEAAEKELEVTQIRKPMLSNDCRCRRGARGQGLAQVCRDPHEDTLENSRRKEYPTLGWKRYSEYIVNTTD